MVMMLLRRANVDQATGFSGLAGEWSGVGHRSVKGQIVEEAKGQLSPYCKSLSGSKQSNPRTSNNARHAGKLGGATCYVVALDRPRWARSLSSIAINQSGAPPHRRRDA